MRDHNHQLIARYLPDKVHYLHGRHGIERARRLVGEQYLRFVHKRPSDGYPLALSSRKLVGFLVVKPCKPHLVQRLARPARTLLPAHSRYGKGKLHIPLNALLRYQIVTLKYKTYPLVTVGIPIAVAVFFGGNAVNAHFAGSIMVKSAYYIQKRSLAAPRRSQHGHKFAVSEIYIYPFERQHPAVARLVKLFYTFQSEHIRLRLPCNKIYSKYILRRTRRHVNIAENFWLKFYRTRAFIPVFR